jgi:quercetin dioxygenase-like cupin family protein
MLRFTQHDHLAIKRSNHLVTFYPRYPARNMKFTMDRNDDASDSLREIFVPAGRDRGNSQRKVLGNLTVHFKVPGQATNGALLVIENVSNGRGGPPRHLHLAQEEWFYAMESEFVVEVGDEQYHLQPGDSILAPRNVPHVWAHVGDEIGRLLIAFQPAGAMEAFFDEMAEMTGPPTMERLKMLFQAHAMEVVGPPL